MSGFFRRSIVFKFGVGEDSRAPRGHSVRSSTVGAHPFLGHFSCCWSDGSPPSSVKRDLPGLAGRLPWPRRRARARNRRRAGAAASAPARPGAKRTSPTWSRSWTPSSCLPLRFERRRPGRRNRRQAALRLGSRLERRGAALRRAAPPPASIARSSAAGSGMSAAWIRRSSAIVAASCGSGAIRTSVEALQQHLPQAVERCPRQPRGQLGGGLALLGRLQHVGPGAGLGPGDRRAAIPSARAAATPGSMPERMRLVELGQRRRRRRRPAPSSSKRRIRPRSARPSMSRTCSAADLALAMGDRLVEDRQAVAGRAFGGAGDHRQRLVLDLDAFGLWRPRRNARRASRPGCGAGRTAGSATAP